MNAPFAARHGNRPAVTEAVVCPNCGSTTAHSCNLIDETPYRTAANSAAVLRHYGEVDAAADVLTCLASVQIINWLRMRWRCSNCGSQFDE